jgi:hypothetical protein
MLISWFAPGTRAHGIPYAAGFGVTDDPRRPQILDGDAELFHHHTQHSPYAQSHIAYALCFDHRVAADEAIAVHEQMLNAMMPARVEGAVLTAGIKHDEPGPFGARDRTAVHAFVSCRNLFRGRFFQPVFRAEGQYRLELAQELINQSAPYPSPKDSARARSISVTTQPRDAGKAEIVGSIRSAVRLIGEDLLTIETLRTTIRAYGAMDVEVDGSRAGQLAVSFSFMNDDGSTARARMRVRPGRIEKLMRGSSLRRLLGDRYVRSPQVFELMRTEFLTQIAIATERWSRKHDADFSRFEEVMDWIHSLRFAPLAKSLPLPVTEVFHRIPNLAAPDCPPSAEREDTFSIRPLRPPSIGG